MQSEFNQHTARVLDGRIIAAQLRATVERRVIGLKERHLLPTLAVVLVGDDPASRAYVQTIERTAQRLGIATVLELVPGDAPQIRIQTLLEDLNADQAIHGILLQQPLPSHLDARFLAQSIDPQKDIDGANAASQGHLMIGSTAYLSPATPRAVMEILKTSRAWPITGKRAVVVGKSSVVGLPVALLLLHEGATVTVTHIHTLDLARYTRDAEILVSAAGVPGLIRGDMLSPGVTIVDVGTTVVGDELKGDVEFASAAAVAAELTPVPGGVGPVTTATLLTNLVDAAEASRTAPPITLKSRQRGA